MFEKLRYLAYCRRMILGYYFLRNGYALMPAQLAFFVTAQCNLRCRMCGQWGELGYFKTDMLDNLKSEEMPLSQWKEVVDHTNSKGSSVIIWGGEPFLYPEIMQLVAYIKQKGLHCLVITNGTLLLPYAREIVRVKLDDIEISLDGPKEINDAIRGKGVYDKVIKGIATLLDVRKKGEKRYPRIILNTVITRDSYQTLEEMIEISKNLGVDGIHFIYGWNIPYAMGKMYEDVCRRLFGIEAHSWKGFEKDRIEMDLGKLSKIIGRIKTKKKKNFDITFLPDIPPSKIEDFYSGRWTGSKKRCFSLWHRADIRYNGDVVFCGDFPDYVVGNVKEEPFLSIWNNKRAREFREKIKKIGLLPICSRCCNLYQYNLPWSLL